MRRENRGVEGGNRRGKRRGSNLRFVTHTAPHTQLFREAVIHSSVGRALRSRPEAMVRFAVFFAIYLFCRRILFENFYLGLLMSYDTNTTQRSPYKAQYVAHINPHSMLYGREH